MVKLRSAGPSRVAVCLCFAALAPWVAACGGDIASDPENTGASSHQAERPEASEGAPPESTQLLRGHLVIGHEVRSFKPCDSEQDLWVVDDTREGLAGPYESLTSGVYQELYVVLLGAVGPAPLDGFGADYAGAITVADLRHAAPESHACNEDLSGIKVQATGNEPFWRVDIRQEEISLAELGSEDRRFSTTSISALESDLQQFRGAAAAEGRQPASASIVVTIEKHPCRDSMSGAYFSYAARVEVDGRELVGCARQGW